MSNTKDGAMFSGLDFGVSRAVLAGNHVFLQGQTGITLDGQGFVGKGDPAAQAENAMQCVKTLLEEAGARMEDICKITTYVTEQSYRAQVYPVIARHLKGVSPVSTGLVVKALAEPVLDFEIDVFAVIPETRD
jgi:enamine deaminase RidA (YjgF/YER057c/UK114 family)